MNNCFDDLLRDFKIHQVALQKAASNSFLVNLCASSPFCTRVMREIACILTVHHESTMDERKAMVIKYSRLIFISRGQTKLCEDTFKELRDREQRDTTCSNLSNLSYYAYMTNMKTIQMHERVEAQPGQHEPEVKADHKDVFLCKPTHQPEGIDIEKTTSRAVWPTFTPQSSKRLYSDISLLRHVSEHGMWKSIGKCWQTTLFARGQVVYHKVRKLFWVMSSGLCSWFGN